MAPQVPLRPIVPPRPIGPRRAPSHWQQMTSNERITRSVKDATETFHYAREFPIVEASDTISEATETATPASPSTRARSVRSHLARKIESKTPTTSPPHSPRVKQTESTTPTTSPPRSPRISKDDSTKELIDVGFSRYLTRTLPAPPNSPVTPSAPVREAGPSNTSVASLSSIVTVIRGPMGNAPPNYRDERHDSGLPEYPQLNLHQQQAYNNHVDIHIDDDNIESTFSNAEAESVSSDEDILSLVSTRSTAATFEEPRSCFQKIKDKMEPFRKFFDGDPLMRMWNSFEVWHSDYKGQRDYDYSKKRERKEQRRREKAVEREQALHRNFERDRARAAREYVDAANDRERDRRVEYVKGRSVRDWMGHLKWNVRRFGRREMEEEQRERVERGEGVMTVTLRTSLEVQQEEGARMRMRDTYPVSR